MKRRQFIQKSALSAVALAMPWAKLHAQSTALCSASFQEFKWVNEKKDSYKIYMNLCKETITKFETAEAENKIIKLVISQNLKNAQNSYDIKEYKADLKFKSVKKMKDSVNDYKIETEFLQENKNEYELPKELNVKKLTLVYHDKPEISTIDVLDKKGNLYLTILEKKAAAATDDDDDDCFITTACTATLGKPDDCDELTMLRKFRDEVLKNSDEGRQLIKEYYQIAPGIVRSIAQSPEMHSIYCNIYKQMILPTIHCIETRDNAGAIEVYRNYTMKLKEDHSA